MRVIDTLLSLGGAPLRFNTAHPLQRAWRDIHFMSMHSAVHAEKNFRPFRPCGVRPRWRRADRRVCSGLGLAHLSQNIRQQKPRDICPGEFVSKRRADDQDAVSAVASRLLRQKSKPMTPRPAAKRKKRERSWNGNC